MSYLSDKNDIIVIHPQKGIKMEKVTVEITVREAEIIRFILLEKGDNLKTSYILTDEIWEIRNTLNQALLNQERATRFN